MLHIKNMSEKMASFVCLEKQTTICTEEVKYADNVQHYFQREHNKGLLFTMSWSGRLWSCSCSRLSQESCLWNEVTPTEGVPPPLATGFYNLQLTIKVAYLTPFLRIYFVKKVSCKNNLLRICGERSAFAQVTSNTQVLSPCPSSGFSKIRHF